MDKLINFISKNSKLIFLALTVIAGIYILWPLNSFQAYLSTGDHGRDLYCFKKTLEGNIPYRDYYWLFGPLMPYYYALFYKLLGISINSVLLGQNILILLAGVVIYLACSIYIAPSLSFACSLAYWVFRSNEFFYTYNHIGGILCILLTIYFLFKYIDKQAKQNIFFGTLCIFFLMLIRLNMGAAVLASFFISIFLVDLVKKNPSSSKNRLLLLMLLICILAITALIYWFFIHSLPKYAIYQSFPYTKGQRTDVSRNPLHAFALFFATTYVHFSATIPRIICGIILLLSITQAFIALFSKKENINYKKNLFLQIFSLLIFAFLCLHEFWASGVYYRLYWTTPVFLIIVAILLNNTLKKATSKTISICIISTIFMLIAIETYNQRNVILSFFNHQHLVSVDKTRIYTSQRMPWFKTFYSTLNYIKKNVPENDYLFVMPLDPLYNFLSKRDSPTRQLVFFEHINIPPEQERKIISDLENKNVNWIIISNRSIDKEDFMGILGKTYCQIIGDYVDKNFKIVAEFGNWTTESSWAWKHGIRVYKRIIPRE